MDELHLEVHRNINKVMGYGDYNSREQNDWKLIVCCAFLRLCSLSLPSLISFSICTEAKRSTLNEQKCEWCVCFTAKTWIFFFYFIFEWSFDSTYTHRDIDRKWKNETTDTEPIDEIIRYHEKGNICHFAT